MQPRPCTGASLGLRTIVLTLTLIAALPIPAGADTAAPPPPVPGMEPEPTPSFRVEGQVGLAMPLGGIGLEASYLPTSGLAVSVGVGKSIKGPTQLAIMPRLHLVRVGRTVHLSVGAGLSYGDYEELDLFLSDSDYYEGALWGNLEVSILATAGGLGVRIFSGYSKFLTHAGDEDTSLPTGLPYIGLGASYAF